MSKADRPKFLHSEDSYRAAWQAAYGAAFAKYWDRKLRHTNDVRLLAIQCADAAVSELRRSRVPTSEGRE